ncbi:MAG: acetylxylan esterase [Anaerolineales bacterium]
MSLYDLPLDELRVYDPPLTREPDFASFWDATRAEGRETPLNATVTPVSYPVLRVRPYEVFYDGWRGARICAWYVVPEGDGPFPAIVQYHGYSGAKHDLYECLSWAGQGYAVMTVDTRGQSGNSSDPGQYTGGHVKGWMTLGVLDPEEYYYRGVFIDCVRALDWLCTRPEIDTQHIGITGMSQGGALTLAVAALDHRPVLAMPEMPYLCHYKRAVDIAERDPYLEIAEYLRRYPERYDQVWRTLSYFDNMNLAEWIQCPTLCSVGLQDDICPPSTVFAAYNKITATKDMAIYRYHNHAQVPAHWELKFHWAHHYLLGRLR